MNENEISHLAFAINALRPDWMIASLKTFLARNMANRTFRDASVALVWVATDRKFDGSWASEKSGRVLEAGPWWRAAAAGEVGDGTKMDRRTRDRECPSHPGQLAENCGGCKVDALVGDTPPAPAGPQHRADAMSYAEKIRADNGFRPKRTDGEVSS